MNTVKRLAMLFITVAIMTVILPLAARSAPAASGTDAAKITLPEGDLQAERYRVFQDDSDGAGTSKLIGTFHCLADAVRFCEMNQEGYAEGDPIDGAYSGAPYLGSYTIELHDADDSPQEIILPEGATWAALQSAIINAGGTTTSILLQGDIFLSAPVVIPYGANIRLISAPGPTAPYTIDVGDGNSYAIMAYGDFCLENIIITGADSGGVSVNGGAVLTMGDDAEIACRGPKVSCSGTPSVFLYIGIAVVALCLGCAAGWILCRSLTPKRPEQDEIGNENGWKAYWMPGEMESDE